MKYFILIIVLLICFFYSKNTFKLKFGNIKEIIDTSGKSCNNKYNRVYPSGHVPGSRLIVTNQEKEMLNQRF